MTIEHNVITDPEIHESKGVSSAAAGRVYVADGAGSGSWIIPEPKGTDTAAVDEMYVADGAGSGAWKANIQGNHGEMVITNNASPTAVIAAADSTLNTDSDYAKITANWALSHALGVSFSTDKMVCAVTGDYIVSFWAAIKIPSTNNFIGVKYAINDTTPYSSQKIVSQSSTTNDYRNVFASGMATLTAGDTVSVYVAGSKSDNLIVEEAGLQLTLLHEI